MRFSLYIARRYFISKSSNNVINIIALFAALGVVIATAILFVVLAGFSGLKTFSLSFYNMADPDIRITSAVGKKIQFNTVLSDVLHTDEVINYSKVLKERVFIQYRDKDYVAQLCGVDNNYTNVVAIDTTLVAGTWLDPNVPYGVVSGLTMANKINLSVDVFNPLKLYMPKPGNNYDLTQPSSMVTTTEVKNIGIFRVMDEWDGKYIFTYLPVVQEMLNYNFQDISEIEVKIKKGLNLQKTAQKLQGELGDKFKVQTREQINATFYKMLKTENLLAYIIATLVLVIALFNIVGTLIMMILDKKQNLKTIYAMGSELKNIQQIFVLQGVMLNLLGMFIGLLIGVLAVVLQQYYGFIKVNSEFAYPVKLALNNIIIVIFTMFVLGISASYIAGKRINKKLLS